MRCVLAFIVAISVSVPCLAAGKPLPPKDALDAAKRLVAETYRKELAAADKTPAVKAMLELAAQTEGDDPAQAALYLGAAEVAARAGETRLAFDAVDQLARVFDVDALQSKATLLDLAAKAAKTNDARVSVANRGLELADAAMSSGRMETADAALKTAASAAAKVRDADLRKDIAAKRKELEREKKHAEQSESKLAGAKKALDANPDDPEANETLGKFLCFERNQWADGLKHLAKSGDQQLQSLAVADMKGAASGAQAAVLGDAWYTLGESADSAQDKAGYQSRAAFWYTRAVADLKGFAKSRIEKRLGEMQEALAAAAAQDGGENGKYIDVTLAPGVLLRLVKIPASADGKVKEFYLGQTEVTQRQWQAVMGSNPSEPKGDSVPVSFITQGDCAQFCSQVNNSTAASRIKLRLPTNEEWFHAFHEGKPASGATISSATGWLLPNSKNSAHPVAQLKPNAFGLYDMLGNTWEWSSTTHNMLGSSFDQDQKAALQPSAMPNDESKAYSIGFRVAAELR